MTTVHPGQQYKGKKTVKCQIKTREEKSETAASP